MSYDSYFTAASKTVESQLAEEDKHLTRIDKASLISEYWPEIGVLEILGSDATNWFQNLIGILNWVVGIGHFNINNLVAELYTFLANPRAGHWWSALYVFSYLKHYDRSKLFYLIMPRNSGNFKEGKNWQEHYPDSED